MGPSPDPVEGLCNDVTPDELHELADAARRAIGPDDPHSLRYSEAAADVIAGRPARYPRATNWIMALHAYEKFTSDHGRWPRENTRARHTLGSAERHLGEWARFQRRFEDRLNTYQWGRLDVSPAFEWDPHATIWSTRLAACRDHQRLTGQLPRLNGADPTEFALARWLGRQLLSLQKGRLDAAKAQQITRLLSWPHGQG